MCIERWAMNLDSGVWRITTARNPSGVQEGNEVSGCGGTLVGNVLVSAAHFTRWRLAHARADASFVAITAHLRPVWHRHRRLHHQLRPTRRRLRWWTGVERDGRRGEG